MLSDHLPRRGAAMPPTASSHWPSPPKFGDLLFTQGGYAGIIRAIHGEGDDAVLVVFLSNGLTVEHRAGACIPALLPGGNCVANFAEILKAERSLQ